MACHIPTFRRRRRWRRRLRGGASSLILLLALGTLFALMALAINAASISGHRVQMQGACESAALAGAAELMDSGHLYARQGHDKGASDADGGRSTSQRIARARQRAVAFAVQNGLGGDRYALDANKSNDARGDLVVGWVEDPTSLTSELIPYSGHGPVNSLRVRASRARAKGNPVTLWFGRVVGILDADVSASARATVDQRVYGFRPVGHTPVPLMPLMVTFAGSVDALQVDASQAAVSGPFSTGCRDRYTLRPNDQCVRRGKDGIPEIILHVRGEEKTEATSADDHEEATEATLLSLSARCFDAAAFRRQVIDGLTPEDLESLGGEFALDDDGRLSVPGTKTLQARQLGALREVLLAAKGRKRIWPLGNAAGSGEVIGFAAGSVIDCYQESESCLAVVVQPCLLQTSTAMVAAGREHNPWIGKLVLSK